MRSHRVNSFVTKPNRNRLNVDPATTSSQLESTSSLLSLFIPRSVYASLLITKNTIVDQFELKFKLIDHHFYTISYRYTLKLTNGYMTSSK